MKRALLYQTTTAILMAGSAAAQAVTGPAEVEDIRGIRGPVAIPVAPDWRPWVWGGLGVLVLGVAIVLIVRGLKRRADARVLTARERALASLEEARGVMSPEASREFAYAVSDALRGFIEVRFRLPSTRQTTEEFLRTVAARCTGLGPYRETLVEFMGLCDLGMFGKWELDEGSMEAMHASALALINAEVNDGNDESAAASPEGGAVGEGQEFQTA
jgi:hypothetical protein